MAITEIDDTLNADVVFTAIAGASTDCADYASGSAAATTVPLPGGLITDSVPPAASARSRRPRMPVPRRRIGAAAAVVGDLAAQEVAVAADATPRASAASACFATLVSASETM